MSTKHTADTKATTPGDLLTIEQAAQRIAMSPRYVRRLVAERQIVFYRLAVRPDRPGRPRGLRHRRAHRAHHRHERVERPEEGCLDRDENAVDGLGASGSESRGAGRPATAQRTG